MVNLKLPKEMKGNELLTTIENVLDELGCKFKVKEDYGIILAEKKGVIISKKIKFEKYKDKYKSILANFFLNRELIYGGNFEKIYNDFNYRDINLNLWMDGNPIENINDGVHHSFKFHYITELLESFNKHLLK